jgi:hypothetical protein
MADDVKLVFAGDSAGAEKAIAALERKFEAFEQKIKRASNTSKKASVETAEGLDKAGMSIVNIASKWAPAIAGATALAGAVRSIGEQTAQWSRDMDAFGERFLERAAKFQVQTGFTDDEAKKNQTEIVKRLEKTPVTDVPTAIGIGQQLASSGIKREDIVSGAAADAVFKLQAGAAMVGKEIQDPMAAVKPMIQFLKGQGVAEPTAADLERVSKAFVGVYGTSDVQLPDMSFLARKAGQLKQYGMGEDTQLATFAALTDVLGGEKAATGIAGFMTRTSTASTVKDRVKALNQIGLTPDDVAMAPGGKDMWDVSKTIMDKLQGLTVEQRNNFMSEMYGEESAPAANIILSPEGQATIRKYEKQAKTPETFDKNVATFQESRFAEQKRFEISKDETMRQALQETPLTWGEVGKQADAAVSKARLEARRKYGDSLQGAASQAAISAVQMAGSGLSWLMESSGYQPQSMGLMGTPRQRAAYENQELLRRNGGVEAAAGFRQQLDAVANRKQPNKEDQQARERSQKVQEEQAASLKNIERLLEKNDRGMPPRRAPGVESN